ncbi:MAG: hypothetical protein LBU24_05015 [Methanocalculaceae archaeon]|nr:hypothetical protein [Methanocalculaceae archaeon]
MITSRTTLRSKHENIAEIQLASESVISARDQCYLMLIVNWGDDVCSQISGLDDPTIMEIAEDQTLWRCM